VKIDRKGVGRTFGAFSALTDVSLEIPSGALTALLGPSGCGKTTLLRIIAGLEAPDAGQVLFDDEPSGQSALGERGVGFVFQHYALFRHMSVFENVAFGLRVKRRRERPSDTAISVKVHELLQLVQLDGLAQRMPSELSGGQRQRVALARALAVEPRVLLLDEPFGALDAGVRRELRRWLRALHERLTVTTVFVTHDQDEALEVADRVVVMNHGRIEQLGTPEEVYAAPATPFVMRFLGDVNLFHARLHEGELRFAAQGDPASHAGVPAHVYVRPHEIELSLEATGALFEAEVKRARRIGPAVRVDLVDAAGRPFEAELDGAEGGAALDWQGRWVFVRMKAKQVFYQDSVDFVI
jgi:sulfate transport system ATP-binding protein